MLREQLNSPRPEPSTARATTKTDQVRRSPDAPTVHPYALDSNTPVLLDPAPQCLTADCVASSSHLRSEDADVVSFTDTPLWS